MSGDHANPLLKAESAPVDEWQAAANELKTRCAMAGIAVEEARTFNGKPSLRVKIPCGRVARTVAVHEASSIRELLDLQFERYRFVGQYNAICSYELGTIEAAMEFGGSEALALRMFGLRPSHSPVITEDQEPRMTELAVSHPSQNSRLVLSPPSGPFLSLVRTKYHSPRATFKVEGVQIAQHDQSVELLERLANAFFFQIDLVHHFHVRLSRFRESPRSYIRPDNRPVPPALEFPRNEFDDAPMTLYWYARGALGMPLLKYLAYYQCIEYYFPAYSKADARRRIRAIIKKPTFRSDRDSDIGLILELMTGRGQGLGDERSQLRATLLECLDPASLRTFLTAYDERSEFFESRRVDRKEAVDWKP